MSSLYGPIDVSSGKASVNISAYPDTQCIVIYNESPLYLNVTFAGAGQHSYPAFTGDIFQARDGFNGSIQITANPYLTTSGQAPANVVFILTYGSTDSLTTTLLKGGSTSFPISLNRLSNIGNSISVGTSASSIVNDGNVAGTQIIESTVTGDAGGSAVTLTNNAVMVLGDVANPGSLTMKGPLTTSGVITSTSTVSLDSGTLTSDGAGNLTCTAVLFNEKAIPRAKISGDAGGNINYDLPNGTRVAQLLTTGVFSTIGGLTITGGKIQLIIGTITKMTALSGTGNATVNTNTAQVPNCVCFDPCTLSGSSQTIGGTLAASTVVTTGSGLAWAAMAYCQ